MKRKYLQRCLGRIGMSLAIMLFSCHFNQLLSQNIPYLTNAIHVHPVSFENVVKSLHKLGYIIASEDKQKQVVKTKFKVYPGTICHTSISVIISDSSALITGEWWSEIAPPQGFKNIMVVCHIDGDDFLFDELQRFAKSLGNRRISYSITKKNNLF